MPLLMLITIFISFFLTACGWTEVNSVNSDDLKIEGISAPPRYAEKITIDDKIPEGSVISPQYENLDFWWEDDVQPMNQEFSRNYFRWSPCTSDCSGHSAWYRWAERNNISDEYDCSNRSASFEEGCIDYVNENN